MVAIMGDLEIKLPKILEKEKINQIVKEYVEAHKDIGVSGRKPSEIMVGRVSLGMGTKEILKEGAKKHGFVRKVAKVPLIGAPIGFAALTARTAVGGYAKDIKKGFVETVYAVSHPKVFLKQLQPLFPEKFPAPLRTPYDAYSELKRLDIEETFYANMSNSMVAFAGRHFAQMKKETARTKQKEVERIEKELRDIMSDTHLTERQRAEMVHSVIERMHYKDKDLEKMSRFVADEYKTYLHDLAEIESRGRVYDIGQVNYVYRLGKRYEFAKRIWEESEKMGARGRDKLFRSLKDDPYGAMGFIEKALLEGKLKKEKITESLRQILGFTETSGFSPSSLPSITSYNESIYARAEEIARKKNKNVDAVWDTAKKDVDKKIKKEYIAIIQGAVRSIADIEYARQFRIGEPKIRTIQDIEKGLRKQFKSWADESPETFVKNSIKLVKRYESKDKTGKTFEERYATAIQETDAFINTFSYYKGGTVVMNRYHKLLEEKKEEAVEKPVILQAVDTPERIIAGAQQDVLVSHPVEINTLAENIEKNPLRFDMHPLEVYSWRIENDKMRIMTPSRLEIKQKALIKPIEKEEKPNNIIGSCALDIGKSLKERAQYEEELSGYSPDKLQDMWINKAPSLNYVPIELFRRPSTLVRGSLRIINPDGVEEDFDPDKEYDYSNTELRHLGKIRGLSLIHI